MMEFAYYLGVPAVETAQSTHGAKDRRLVSWLALLQHLRFGGLGSGDANRRIYGPDGSAWTKIVPVWYVDALGKVGAFRNLPLNWDGNDSIPPSEAACDVADSILDGLSAAKIRPERILALSDGGIGFYLSRPVGYAGLQTYNDGSILAIEKGASVNDVETWDVFNSTESIADTIERLVS